MPLLSQERWHWRETISGTWGATANVGFAFGFGSILPRSRILIFYRPFRRGRGSGRHRECRQKKAWVRSEYRSNNNVTYIALSVTKIRRFPLLCAEMKYLNTPLPRNCDWRVLFMLIAFARRIFVASVWPQELSVNAPKVIEITSANEAPLFAPCSYQLMTIFFTYWPFSL